METKLTLRLNENVINRAKAYAKKHHVSLSKIIESYLDGITSSTKDEKKEDITPLVKSLTGVINLSDEKDDKSIYREFLDKKYL